VKGFEESQSRLKLLEKAKELGYCCEEYLLSPIQFGVPNSRLRYYFLATLNHKESPGGAVARVLPVDCCVSLEDTEESRTNAQRQIRDYLEEYVDPTPHRIKAEHVTKRGRVMDILTADSRRSCCFTGGYSRYAEGTGSVLRLTPPSEEEIEPMQRAIELGRSYDYAGDWSILELRYFTPREILNLHCFPETYSFPSSCTVKQCYKLLGNSINAHVVEQLCRHILRHEGTLIDANFAATLHHLPATGNAPKRQKKES